MNTKEEALKLADEMESENCEMGVIKNVVPAMIRRLVEELEKQGEPVAWMHKEIKTLVYEADSENWEVNHWIPLYTTPQTKRLSDEEILAISNTMPYANRFEFARAIEERHGIK